MGYIVLDEDGWDSFSYGASEKWFPNYDGAMAYAMEIVRQNAESYEKKYVPSAVIIYEGDEDILHQTHSCPCGRVVFEWRNYGRRQ